MPSIKTTTPKMYASIMRNQAGQQTINMLNRSSEYFTKSYITFVKTNGSILDADQQTFNQFISNVDANFTTQLKQMVNSYPIPINNLKQQRQWNSFINTLKNAYKKNDRIRLKTALYQVSNYQLLVISYQLLVNNIYYQFDNKYLIIEKSITYIDNINYT